MEIDGEYFSDPYYYEHNPYYDEFYSLPLFFSAYPLFPISCWCFPSMSLETFCERVLTGLINTN